MKVLIIEDDPQLNKAIKNYLEMQGFSTVCVYDGLEALELIDTIGFDLYLIDIDIPKVTGLELLEHIRTTNLSTPVVIITASVEIENIDKTFNAGYSEYLKKPFHLRELLLRIDRLFDGANETLVEIKEGFSYNLSTKTFIDKNMPVVLRPKERRLCTILMEYRNTVVSYRDLEAYIWEGEIREYYPLRQLLAEVRPKLPANLIKTVTRAGYMIEIPATTVV